MYHERKEEKKEEFQNYQKITEKKFNMQKKGVRY